LSLIATTTTIATETVVAATIIIKPKQLKSSVTHA
jgi:hypothetical protein